MADDTEKRKLKEMKGNYATLIIMKNLACKSKENKKETIIIIKKDSIMAKSQTKSSMKWTLDEIYI